MKENVFITAEGIPGHLEFVGPALTTHGSRYCWRSEIRETRAGFEVHDVEYRKSWGQWQEERRNVFGPPIAYQSKAEAIEAVKQHERGWFEAIADDLAEQRERDLIEAGWDLGRNVGRYSRDIVDMVYDDGLTNKEALELEKHRPADAIPEAFQKKLKPVGFLGKDILAVEMDSKAYREDLARAFREALPPMPDKTCDWCGVDLGIVKDHKIVDAQRMCFDCVQQYSLEEGRDYER